MAPRKVKLIHSLIIYVVINSLKDSVVSLNQLENAWLLLKSQESKPI
ncbi:MAG: hypothetical protein K0B37_10740 [Bacteroidales bacterium]|nr:hypothetical protein [Bacteroidales bacterium]